MSIFDNAKFGDKLVTRNGEKALFVSQTFSKGHRVEVLYEHDINLSCIDYETGMYFEDTESGRDIVGLIN